jgi:hypothetical protein
VGELGCWFLDGAAANGKEADQIWLEWATVEPRKGGTTEATADQVTEVGTSSSQIVVESARADEVIE